MAPVVRTAAPPRLTSSHRPERVSKFLRSSTLTSRVSGSGVPLRRDMDRLAAACESTALVVPSPVGVLTAVVAWVLMPCSFQ
jgi:hypothetical protein